MADESTVDIKTRIFQLQQSIRQNPQNIPAYQEAATIFVRTGNHNQALQILSHALRVAPAHQGICQQMVPLLAPITPSAYHPELDNDLRECLQQELIDHQQLAYLAAEHLLHKYPADQLHLNQHLADDTLFLRFMSRCINVHSQMELMLVRLREILLNECITKNSLSASEKNLISSIALQAFNNEYLWPVSTNEDNLINQHFSSELSAHHYFILTMYQPLHQFVNADQTLQLNNEIQHQLLDELITTTFKHVTDEAHLAAQIPSLTSTCPHTISTKVRTQYEQNPYPRWRTPSAPKRGSLKEYIQRLPGIEKLSFNDQPLQLLVAGCGTGFEPIDLARMDKELTITALDLSKTSLAYGQRMAKNLGINIRFIQGDILDVGLLNQQFDVINSTGVLHHMENPEAGWQALCAVTRPGGIMRISLYSELARKRIVVARQLIREHHLNDTLDDIKKCRAMIFNVEKKNPLRDLLQSQDFYSTSGCRDLLFHVQEHRFTLLQIQSLIKRLGLKLVGFDVSPELAIQFTRDYSGSILDLERWHQFETRHPDSFAGMYKLWLQKL